MLVAVNVAYLAMVRAASRGAAARVAGTAGLWLQILLDLAVLTVVVHYLGSLETYAPFMYLFHIVLACIFFPLRAEPAGDALGHGDVPGLRSAWKALGVVPPDPCWRVSLMPDRERRAAGRRWRAYFGSVVFISGTVWYLASRLAGALRQRDAELAAINRRLVAATEERARYMLRTTHQLKAPVCGHPRQHPTPAGRLLRADPDRGRRRDRTDRGPLRDAVAGNQGHAATGQPAVAAPRTRPRRSRSICRR